MGVRALGTKIYGYQPAFLEEVRRHPEQVAAIDQYRAAETEAMTRLREAVAETGEMNHRELNDPARAVTAAAAVTIAMLRAVEARCRHTDWPPTATSSRTFVSLTSRAAVCGRPRCVEALRARWHDDGRCELCERASDMFTPFVVPSGPCVVTLELCDDCAPLMGEDEAA
jgi:hypothetical protein